MSQRFTILFSLLFICVLFVPHMIFAAGFGITPPYVKNEELTRNSKYEQRITLVRGDPQEDMLAQISVDVPGANDWITIDKGDEFLMPAGEQRVPMVVSVHVPENADFDEYEGRIRIRVVNADGSRTGEGAVTIVLGAQVNVDLGVIDRVIHDFEVRRVSIDNLNEGRQVRWLEYPGKIKFAMRLKNIGNVPVAPEKIEFQIYDAKGENLLEVTENSNRLNKVDPFDTEEVIAELPTHLPAGSYLARFTVYNKGEEVKREGELSLSILPKDTIPGDDGYGFMGLSLWHKTTIVGPIVLVILLVVVPVFTFSSRARRKVRHGVYVTLVLIGKVAQTVKNIVLGAPKLFNRSKQKKALSVDE